jgi:cellobiose transport system substrate-binding protein
MSTTRRHFLAAAGASLLGGVVLAGCGRGGYLTKEGTLSLWYWDRSISDTILAEAPKVTGHKLQPQKVPNDYKAKLLTSLAGNAYIPDMAGLNEDVATYFPDADQFWDLNELGAKEVEGDYLDWKWQRGVTPDGRLIGFPMDTGPTALYYRQDLFDKAGLPTEPDDVAAELDTWEKYLQAGEQYKKATGKFMMDNINRVFTQSVAQQATRYMDEQGKFIGDGPQIKDAWDLAVQAAQLKLAANVEDWTPDWNAAYSTGAAASFVGAVWMAPPLKEGAANTEGKWRVCRAPGGAGNNGGSFIAILKASRDPEAAWETIKWVQSPENQIKAYNEIQLFPAAKEGLTSQKVLVEEKFFGNQVINEVFGKSASEVKPVYLSPYDNLISGPITEQITNIWAANKKPDRAWDDALAEVDRQLQHRGLI